MRKGGGGGGKGGSRKKKGLINEKGWTTLGEGGEWTHPKEEIRGYGKKGRVEGEPNRHLTWTEGE